MTTRVEIESLTTRDDRRRGGRGVRGGRPAPPPGPRTKPIRWLMAVTANSVLIFTGCDNKPQQTGPAVTVSPETPEQAHERIERAMSSIDHIFDFQRLGQTTSVEDGVARLNDWQRASGSIEKSEAAALPAGAKTLLSEEQREAIDQPRFSLRDGEHLRDCLMERAVSTYGIGAGQSELEKVTNLFGHIVRAVGLVESPLLDLPLAPYEFYLLGKGTAEERAWMFVDVLRQLRIDAVLLFPKGSQEPRAGQPARRLFLVGVLLDDEVYLFDPASGVPIPAPGSEQSENIRPATLAQAATDPAVLKQLDAGKGRDFPIAAADLAAPEVALVGDTSCFSARMQALQTQFVGARAMVISEPLGDSEGIPGLRSRVAKGAPGRWSAENITLWKYPEAQETARTGMDSLQNAGFTGLFRPFSAYKHVMRDPQTGLHRLVEQEEHADPAGGKFDPDKGAHTVRRTTTGEQMRARLFQLSGDFAEAIKRYTDVRLSSRNVLETISIPIERTLHARAIDDATYWTALCKYEQGEFKSAADMLDKYVKQPEPGAWAREARSLRALSLAAAGDKPAAVRALQSVEPDDLEYAGCRLLIRRWQSQAEGAKAQASRAETE